MLYPMYVHHDEDSAWSASFPDLPGCFAAADALQDLPRAAQEAVQAHYSFDGDTIPTPSTPDKWFEYPDYRDGVWMMVDIDISRIRARAVRLNISLPESLIQDIDAYARQHGQTRSGFLAQATRAAMQVHTS